MAFTRSDEPRGSHLFKINSETRFDVCYKNHFLRASAPQQKPNEKLARRLKKSKGSSLQGFQLQNPGGTHADEAGAVAVPVGDEETVRVEEADTRDETGVHLRGLHRPLLARRPVGAIAPLTGLAKDQDVLGDFRNRRRHFVFRRKHRHLVFRRPARRARDDFPKHDVQPRFERGDVRVRLAGVPRIVIEVELRLPIRRMELEPLRHRQRIAVDRRHPHECEVCLPDQLTFVEWTRALQDFLDP